MNKLIVLAALIITGILLKVFGLFHPEEMIAIGRQYTDNWWLPVILILLQMLLFTFAQAGSLFLWVAATLYTPVTATLILAIGSTLGGVTAYLFSARLSVEWVRRIENSNTYKLLRKQDNFFTLLAMRVMPAFPHGLINYSSGILKTKLVYFVPAAFIGIALKSYVYSKVIYSAASGASLGDLFNFATIGPLVLLSVVIIAGVFIKHKYDQSRGISVE